MERTIFCSCITRKYFLRMIYMFLIRLPAGHYGERQGPSLPRQPNFSLPLLKIRWLEIRLCCHDAYAAVGEKDTRATITEVYGNFDVWISTRIEQLVQETKNIFRVSLEFLRKM